MLKWIVRVAVALHTGKSGSHSSLPGSVNPVHNSRCSKLFVIGSTFVVGHGVAMESSGYKLFVCCVGQQIAGQLFN